MTYFLSPAALHYAERDVQGHGLRDGCCASHAACPMSPASISRASPERPSTLSRTFRPSVPMSTRSTSSATMRACSAGKSSSHSGSSCCRAARALVLVIQRSCSKGAEGPPANTLACASALTERRAGLISEMEAGGPGSGLYGARHTVWRARTVPPVQRWSRTIWIPPCRRELERDADYDAAQARSHLAGLTLQSEPHPAGMGRIVDIRCTCGTMAREAGSRHCCSAEVPRGSGDDCNARRRPRWPAQGRPGDSSSRAGCGSSRSGASARSCPGSGRAIAYGRGRRRGSRRSTCISGCGG